MDAIMEQGEDDLLTRRVGGAGGVGGIRGIGGATWGTWSIARGARRRGGRRRRASLSSTAHHGEVCDKKSVRWFFKEKKNQEDSHTGEGTGERESSGVVSGW